MTSTVTATMTDGAATAAPDITPDITPDGGLIPARPLAAQAHALRAAAAFIERAGIAGLSVTVDDQIAIQVPVHLAGPAARTAAVAILAAAAGGQAIRDTDPGRATHGWVTAHGDLAGHAVHIFTAIAETP
jgi:hypothetical protein